MYKIEITADTLAELSGKVLSLASKLMTGTATEAGQGVAKVAPTPKPAPAAVETASSPSDTVIASPDTTAQPETSTSNDVSAASSASEDEELEVVDLPIDTLDFETDVRPMVLKVVEKCGKPVMEEILSRFGVAKASMIEPALLPELVSLCQEAMAK
jgi:hypothetical protein